MNPALGPPQLSRFAKDLQSQGVLYQRRKAAFTGNSLSPGVCSISTLLRSRADSVESRATFVGLSGDLCSYGQSCWHCVHGVCLARTSPTGGNGPSFEGRVPKLHSPERTALVRPPRLVNICIPRMPFTRGASQHRAFSDQEVVIRCKGRPMCCG